MNVSVSATQERAEDAVQRLDIYLHVLSAIIETLASENEDLDEVVTEIATVYQDLRKIMQCWVDIEVGITPGLPARGLLV